VAGVGNLSEWGGNKKVFGWSVKIWLKLIEKEKRTKIYITNAIYHDTALIGNRVLVQMLLSIRKKVEVGA
jgi:hypothetical protein